MLISVQGTTPKNSSIAVQHCTEEPTSSLACSHSSTTTPNLAIFSERRRRDTAASKHSR